MSQTIQTQLAHRSIRQFTTQPIADDIIEQLINAGRSSSTSNNLQCVSIIRVQDPAKRQALMKYCSDQEYVKSAAEFWVFCADFHKHKTIYPQAQTDYTEVLLIGAIDTGIMAQNVLIAAESLGLGGVYIGSLRNEIEKVSELLNLPEHTLPLVGLCLGYPDQDPPLKPRLPKSMMFFKDQYQSFSNEDLTAYNQQVADYYQQRSQTQMDWTGNIQKALGKPVRPHILPFLQKQGFAKK